MKLKKLLPSVAVLVCAMILLFGVSALLKPITAKNKEKDKQQAIAMLLPEGETFTQEAYEGEDTNIKEVFKGETGCVVSTVVAGYVDDISILVGVDNNGKVTGVMVEEIAETWGLGRRAMTDYTFLSQFLDTAGDAEIGTNVDALTGATVTSKAVTKAINSASAYVTGADTSSSATEWEG